jgi:hypothetical protein
MGWAPEAPPDALEQAALGRCRTLLVLRGVAVGAKIDLKTFQIHLSHLVGP